MRLCARVSENNYQIVASPKKISQEETVNKNELRPISPNSVSLYICIFAILILNIYPKTPSIITNIDLHAYVLLVPGLSV